MRRPEHLLVAVDLVAPVLLVWPWSALYRRWIAPAAAAVVESWLIADTAWDAPEVGVA